MCSIKNITSPHKRQVMEWCGKLLGPTMISENWSHSSWFSRLFGDFLAIFVRKMERNIWLFTFYMVLAGFFRARGESVSLAAAAVFINFRPIAGRAERPVLFFAVHFTTVIPSAVSKRMAFRTSPWKLFVTIWLIETGRSSYIIMIYLLTPIIHAGHQ